MEQPAAPNAGQSNQEFRDSFVAAIYEASPDGILVVDKHDVIVSHNQRRVLKMLCVVCMRILRQTDLMARVGGEEFAIVVPDTNLDGATLLAERVRLAVADQAQAEGGDMIRVTLSAGVSALAPDGRNSAPKAYSPAGSG
jgi:GGDEF domain-containing protein